MGILFCDSNCELWYDKVEALGLHVIRMPYALNGEEHLYDMGKATDFSGFYASVRTGAVPSTAALSSRTYIEYFEPFFNRDEDILYLSFSHKLSATFAQLDIALKELKERYPGRTCTVLDMRLVSAPAALVVLETAKFFNKCKDIQKTVAFAKTCIDHTSVYFTVDNLHSLKRGKHLRGLPLIGTLCVGKPVLHLNREGAVKRYASARGRKNPFDVIFEEAKKLDIDFSHPTLMIEAGAEQKDIELFKECFVRHFGIDKPIWMQPVGPVIGTHCGPGTLGFAFMHKKERG